MTTKAEFDAQEWETVIEGPALAGAIVATAQKGGTIRESVAMAKVYAEAGKAHEGNELLGEVAAKPPQIGAREFSSAEDLRAKGLERIANAVAILEPKATHGGGRGLQALLPRCRRARGGGRQVGRLSRHRRRARHR